MIFFFVNNYFKITTKRNSLNFVIKQQMENDIYLNQS